MGFRFVSSRFVGFCRCFHAVVENNGAVMAQSAADPDAHSEHRDACPAQCECPLIPRVSKVGAVNTHLFLDYLRVGAGNTHLFLDFCFWKIWLSSHSSDQSFGEGINFFAWTGSRT